MSQMAADEDTVARAFSQSKTEGRAVFLNLILPFLSSFQHLVLDLMQ